MPRNAINPKGLSAAGPYSHAVKTGNLVFLAGKTGTDSAGKLADGGIGPQTKQTFANLKVVLEAAGLTFDHVVKCNVYLTNMGDFAAMNAIYAEHFSKPEPARTTVAVAALPGGAIVEIEMVAEKT
jgi:2-iminobutanoate/2-iminopropanoate deaminase